MFWFGVQEGLHRVIGRSSILKCVRLMVVRTQFGFVCILDYGIGRSSVMSGSVLPRIGIHMWAFYNISVKSVSKGIYAILRPCGHYKMPPQRINKILTLFAANYVSQNFHICFVLMYWLLYRGCGFRGVDSW